MALSEYAPKQFWIICISSKEPKVSLEIIFLSIFVSNETNAETCPYITPYKISKDFPISFFSIFLTFSELDIFEKLLAIKLEFNEAPA